MNIAMLTYEFPPYVNGGLGNYCRKMAEYLLKKDNRLYVFGYNTGDLPAVERNKNLTVFRPFVRLFTFKWLQKPGKKNNLKNPFFYYFSVACYNVLAFIKLIQSNHECRFDIIAVHDWISSFTGILAAIFLKAPVVFHIHNTHISMTEWSKKNIVSTMIIFLESLLAGMADKIIVPSEKMRHLLERKGWNKDKIEIIVHGSDGELVRKVKTQEIISKTGKLEEAFRFPPSSVKLLYVGRLVPEKGILNLLRALPLVLEKHEDTRLIVAGKGDVPAFEDEIQMFIENHSLHEYAHVYYRFLNFEDVICHYLYSDICIFPSMYEPFGLVALEAMALGKPVILGNGFCRSTFDYPGNAPALFVDGNNPSSIAGGIRQLMENPGLVRRIVENAFKYILPRFSWNNTADNTLLTYKKIIEEKK